jgi:DNA-binding NtrC family response regulator
MTTALIGKAGVGASQARVAIVSRAGIAGLSNYLQRQGHEVAEAASWSALSAPTDGASAWDLVFCDEESLAEARNASAVPVLLVSDRTTACATGVHGVVSGNGIDANLDIFLQLAISLRTVELQRLELERLVGGIRSGSVLAGRSSLHRRLLGVISRAADCEATILIEGPTGSGKSLVAAIVHGKSRRAGRALEVHDCADLDAEGMAKALAGARGTTLVLDAIERTPAAGQAVLVRHLKERSSPRPDPMPRIIATTAAHLPELVARGSFREDLYYRLNAFPMVVPALRERTDDILPIAESLLALAAAQHGQQMRGFTAAAATLLESMPWPGNVAQLELVVRRAQLQARGGLIDRDHLIAPVALPGQVPAASTAVAAQGGSNSAAEETIAEAAIRPFEEEEQILLTRALRATKGNVRRAAQLLGIGRATLYRKIQQYRLRLQ